ncbi:MAG: ABC transporter substrate-binding protein/permease [Planctomycetia bacterium]|nr:ABC transporter substrate-binding protein/permease [Planctomycetia bacterium]
MPNRRRFQLMRVVAVVACSLLIGAVIEPIFFGHGRVDGAELDAAHIARVRERLKSNVLRWGGDAEGGAPFQFYEAAKPDTLVGFEVDLVAALVEEMRKQYDLPELRPEFVQYEWVSLPQGLEKGDFDAIVSGFEITTDNLNKVRMSRPYYLFWQQLTIRNDESSIYSLDDCRTKTIGTLASSAASEYLASRHFTGVTAYEGQIEPYQDLTNHRIDAVLLDSPIAIYNTGGRPMLRLVGKPEGWGGYGVASRKAETDLIDAVDHSLATLQKSGKLETIYRRWNMWNDDQTRLAELDTPLKLTQWTQSLRTDRVESTQEWTFSRYAPLLLAAAWVTIRLTFLSMAVAMTLGLLVAVCRLFGPAPIRAGALIYVELFRGTPLLLLLTFLYYGCPSIGITLSAWQAAIIGFGLNYAAFEAEIYRSSILSVPQGQWEAARALGMSDTATFRRIIFPQAIRTALGPMTNDFVAMFKDTSLVSVIAVVELTKQYQILARTSLKFVELGLLTAALYLAMSVPLGYLARYLEEKWSGGK